MFKEMRRIDRKLKMEENIEILNAGEYGFLATSSVDGYPYITPLNYIYFNSCIYFHCANEGQKIDNINKNEKVSFCITADINIIPNEFTTKYRSVIVFGKASEVLEKEKVLVLQSFIKKYADNYIEKGNQYIGNLLNKTKVIKIEIEHVTGKGNL